MLLPPLRAVQAVLLLLAGAPAGEEVYTWTDAEGVAHYTNDANAVPQRYRDKAHTLEGQPLVAKEAAAAPASSDGKPAAEEPSKASAPAKPTAAEATFEESAPPPPALSPSEAAALDEAGWRKRFQRSNERVRRAELNLERDQEQLKRVANQESYMVVDPYGRVMTAGQATALRMQVAEDERVLREARDALYDLERLAAREAIPLEWRR